MSFSAYNTWYKLQKTFASAFKSYWHYLPNRWYLLILFILQAGLWYLAYYIFNLVGEELFVSHYNVDFGIDGIGSAKQVFQIPIVTLVILLVNIGLVITIARKRIFHFLAHTLTLATLLLHFLAYLALMSLYLINFLA
jgi:hypothetical protein